MVPTRRSRDASIDNSVNAPIGLAPYAAAVSITLVNVLLHRFRFPADVYTVCTSDQKARISEYGRNGQPETDLDAVFPIEPSFQLKRMLVGRA